MMNKSINEVYKFYNLADRDYSVRKIDGEQVIYKNYKNFDIEVSGLDNYRKKRIYGKVYIWENRCKIVKSIEYKSFIELNNILNKIENSYLEEIIKSDF